MLSTYAPPSTDLLDTPFGGSSQSNFIKRSGLGIPEPRGPQAVVLFSQWRLGVMLSKAATTTADADLPMMIYRCSFPTRNESFLSHEEPGANIRWIFEVATSTEENGASLVGTVIDGVNALISNGDFKGIDRALESIPVEENASRHVLVTMARATFPVRSKLTAWQGFVRAVASSFAARGIDYTRLLKGLV